MKKSIICLTLCFLIILSWCNKSNNDNYFNNNLKCQELKEEFFNDMIDRFYRASASSYEYGDNLVPILAVDKKNLEIFYSPVTNSCVWTIRDVAIKYDWKFPEFWQSYFVIKDLFNSDECKINDVDYYDYSGNIDQKQLLSICSLPEYNDSMFSLFTFTWNDISKNIGLSRKIFESEIDFLKWNK